MESVTSLSGVIPALVIAVRVVSSVGMMCATAARRVATARTIVVSAQPRVGIVRVVLERVVAFVLRIAESVQRGVVTITVM